MNDEKIIGLYLERSEDAVKQTELKYGRLALSIAGKLLDSEGSKECVNDALLKVWNSIPPEKPNDLRAYICKIVRNISLNRLKFNTRAKRSEEYAVSLTELEELIPDSSLDIADGELKCVLDAFLEALGTDMRNVFLRRYWFFDPISEIARRYGYSEDKVNGMLRRTRKKLRDYLKKEGYNV